MIATFEQVQSIVKDNPRKAIIEKGREISKKLMLHLHGEGMDEAIRHCEHFASKDVFDVQKAYAVSNIDLFARILQKEDMVFTARGGSSDFKMDGADEIALNNLLDNIHHGISLRKWIKTFGLEAFRADPMGVIFIEIEQMEVNETSVNEPKCYPTYKSINDIYDYDTHGRRLEYICFHLSIGEAKEFGIKDESLNKGNNKAKSVFYRFVDDAKDLIVMLKDTQVRLVTTIDQQNPLPNIWKRTPGFIVSDLMKFNSPECFYSPVSSIVELADTFLQDRSVRDLQKKFHGFAKPVEPLLACGTCAGNKTVNGENCKDCTPPGGEPTGYKLKTKVSDVARFPLEILENSSFDFKRIFGYVTPDIEGWEKQDVSLEALEALMERTYWGTSKTITGGPSGKQVSNPNESATATLANLQPTYARLNTIADWAEKTEAEIANYIGQFWFPDKFKQCSINYGRDYILKTPEEFMDDYQLMLKGGAPDFALDIAFQRYLKALYQNSPNDMVKYLKMLEVEPFPHNSSSMVEQSTIIPFADKVAKRYFGEWKDTVKKIDWIRKPATELKQDLQTYISSKNIKEPVKEPAAV